MTVLNAGHFARSSVGVVLKRPMIFVAGESRNATLFGSGLELCRRIREFDPHTLILFYSACAYPHDLQAAFSAGAQKYLVKLVRFDDMTRAVEHLISV
ncbi:MAG TPA: response regulator [Blastocatellia bacterium]|nr:response regulator [Blastocatellia bacterium]